VFLGHRTCIGAHRNESQAFFRSEMRRNMTSTTGNRCSERPVVTCVNVLLAPTGFSIVIYSFALRKILKSNSHCNRVTFVELRRCCRSSSTRRSRNRYITLKMKQTNDGVFERWNMSPVVYHDGTFARAATCECICMRMTNRSAQRPFAQIDWSSACIYMFGAMEQENGAFQSIHRCT
jgi:hypothetical protein